MGTVAVVGLGLGIGDLMGLVGGGCSICQVVTGK